MNQTFSEKKTYRSNDGFSNKRADRLRAKSLELCVELLGKPSNILFDALAWEKAAVGIACRYTADVLWENWFKHSFPALEVTNRQCRDGATVPGAFTGDEPASCRLGGREL